MCITIFKKKIQITIYKTLYIHAIIKHKRNVNTMKTKYIEQIFQIYTKGNRYYCNVLQSNENTWKPVSDNLPD